MYNKVIVGSMSACDNCSQVLMLHRISGKCNQFIGTYAKVKGKYVRYDQVYSTWFYYDPDFICSLALLVKRIRACTT